MAEREPLSEAEIEELCCAENMDALGRQDAPSLQRLIAEHRALRLRVAELERDNATLEESHDLACEQRNQALESSAEYTRRIAALETEVRVLRDVAEAARDHERDLQAAGREDGDGE